MNMTPIFKVAKCVFKSKDVFRTARENMNDLTISSSGPTFLNLLCSVKIKWDFFQIFEAFSEYLHIKNLNKNHEKIAIEILTKVAHRYLNLLHMSAFQRRFSN